MSYCVNCGVELSDGAASCPLCGTPAWKPDREALPYFPTKPTVVPPASRRAAALLLTAMLASVSLCCGLLNLILPTEHPWSLYIAGAAVMLWIWFALPMLARRIPVFFRLTADVAAIGIEFLHASHQSQTAFLHKIVKGNTECPIDFYLCAPYFMRRHFDKTQIVFHKTVQRIHVPVLRQRTQFFVINCRHVHLLLA